MALVSYDNSDSESDISSEQEFNKEEDVTIINKEVVKKNIKIQIPRLSNFNTEEEPSKKIIKTNQNFSSGLFNILPAPIHKPPDKICKFDAAVVKEKNLIPRTVKTGHHKINDNQEGEEIYNGNYFFSNASIKTKNIHEKNLSVSLNIKVNSAPIKKDISVKTNAYFSNLVSKTVDEKAVTKLELEPNLTGDKVVDINLAEFKNDWKMNALKDKTSSVSSKAEQKADEPSAVSKRKHQITYLAYQAKKNEEQLKEQWALNKMTRKQTQAKYGF